MSISRPHGEVVHRIQITPSVTGLSPPSQGGHKHDHPEQCKEHTTVPPSCAVGKDEHDKGDDKPQGCKGQLSVCHVFLGIVEPDREHGRGSIYIVAPVCLIRLLITSRIAMYGMRNNRETTAFVVSNPV